jgi:hypothetical protein
MQPIVDLAALLAQVQQLTQTVQALQAQNKALQDQLDTQLAAVPAATPAPVPAPVQEIKIATPDPYDGSSDRIEHFLHQCEVYFLGLPGLTDHQHVMFAISYMNKGCTFCGLSGWWRRSRSLATSPVGEHSRLT